MEYRRFGEKVLVRIDRGEELFQQLEEVAQREGIQLASVQGLGAVDDFTVGVFRVDRKEFVANRFQGAYEIVSLAGTIDRMDGKFYCHLHMSAGDAQGRVVGGHLKRAVVSATCELVLSLVDGAVDRFFDPEVGLNLWRLQGGL